MPRDRRAHPRLVNQDALISTGLVHGSKGGGGDATDGGKSFARHLDDWMRNDGSTTTGPGGAGTNGAHQRLGVALVKVDRIAPPTRLDFRLSRAASIFQFHLGIYGTRRPQLSISVLE